MTDKIGPPSDANHDKVPMALAWATLIPNPVAVALAVIPMMVLPTVVMVMGIDVRDFFSNGFDLTPD